jgi:membrane protein DedA with SNARE-associated domain
VVAPGAGTTDAPPFEVMGDALLHGSMILVFVWLILGGLGAPLPEDLAVLTAGALVHHGQVSPVVAVCTVFLGVLGGDAMLFLIARRLGPAAYERRVFRRLLPERRRIRIEEAYRRHGGRIVFFARYMGVVRAAAFAMAGIHGMKPRRFLCWDALAATISLPLMLTLGYLGAGVGTVQHYAVLVAIVAVIGGLTWRRFRPHRRTR